MVIVTRESGLAGETVSSRDRIRTHRVRVQAVQHKSKGTVFLYGTETVKRDLKNGTN